MVIVDKVEQAWLSNPRNQFASRVCYLSTVALKNLLFLGKIFPLVSATALSSMATTNDL